MDTLYVEEYTKDFLQKLCKLQLTAMVLSQRDETKSAIESLRDEATAMNTNFKKLEADVSIAKKVNNILMKKSVEIKQ